MKKQVTIICALLLLFATTTAQNKPDNLHKMKTFVLVHGSWHSAWNWYRVTPILERLGHRVIAPDLPGMGRDKTPLSEVTFDGNVKFFTSILDTIQSNVILVGHSKNGVLITQIAQERPQKIERLVYLAAVLPANGKSAVDYFKLDQHEVLGPHITYYPESNSSKLNPSIYKTGLYHDCDNEIVEMAKVLLSNEPRQTATVPVAITDDKYGTVPRYYIECTEDRAITPWLQQMMYRQISCKKVFRMATSHSPFFSKPQELVEILLAISGDEEN